MILNHNLYFIQDVRREENGASYTITLNPECVIYKAHFPEMPITPGVCVIQIVKELLELTIDRKVNITGVKNAKFLSVMQPEGQLITVSISNIKEEGQKVNAQSVVVGKDGVNYAKISLQTVNA